MFVLHTYLPIINEKNNKKVAWIIARCVFKISLFFYSADPFSKINVNESVYS